MKKKQLVTFILIAVLFIGIYFVGNYYSDLRTYRKQVNGININSINMMDIKDGTYTGSYEIMWIAAVVEVTVYNNEIKGIELIEHINDRGTPAEIITSRVIENQSLDVDVVTGATSSSKVILKAIENALKSGLKSKDDCCRV